ncbi:hypothetical protein SUGI_1097740 [Cryptomeria japonica]|nr:hypothetical protein SUGI_1097740 [Cryptomeria japonica]
MRVLLTEKMQRGDGLLREATTIDGRRLVDNPNDQALGHGRLRGMSCSGTEGKKWTPIHRGDKRQFPSADIVISEPEQRDWILDNGPFFIEGKGLNISVWSPNFNPFEATIEKTLIWIKLRGLPQEYKDVETLKQIGNHLGEFVKSEELVDPLDFSMISRLCVNWQTVHNLPDTLEIKTGMGIWKQKLELRGRNGILCEMP